MSETSKKIIEEIHERHIKHRPRWYFLIRSASVWTALAATVIFGALSVSIEESILERGLFGRGILDLLQGVSLLWIVSALVFIVLAFFNLKHVKESYRYRAWWIVLGAVVLVATFATLFCHEGIGSQVESALEHNAFYHHALHGIDGYQIYPTPGVGDPHGL